MRDLPHPDTIKTSAPSLIGAIDRPRLIDATARLPTAAKWLQAPSGSGKSTMVASYAHSRAKPFAWYRLDERDNDPAFFYEEFAKAVSAQLQFTDVLTKFSSDDYDSKLNFARRFFGKLAAQIERASVLVFDDVHRLTTATMLSALALITKIASAQVEVLFVSEMTAPVEFFEAIASGQLTLLNDVDFHFNVDECKAMTAARRIQTARSDDIHAITGGHAGALVLACELLRSTDPSSPSGAQTIERIHAHLLSKLIEYMPPARRELLLRTAFVAQLTRPIAEALAGREAAQQIDALTESGVLRTTGSGETEAFEAHGLVRQGIQTLLRARLGADAVRDLAEITATALLERVQPEAAFNLLIQIGSVARAIEVLEQLAERLAKQGQTDLLVSCLNKLPVSEAHSNAWLCFWTGQALLRVDEEQARVWFARSYTAFEASRDVSGMRLAAACMVIAFGLEHADLRELEQWIQRHREAGGELPATSTEHFEATLLMAIICAALMHGAYPPQIGPEVLIPRFQQLLESEEAWLSDDQRVQAARLLVEHARIFRSQIQAPNAIVATQRLALSGTGGALHKGRWLIAAAYSHFQKGNATESLEYLQQAQALASKSNSLRFQFELSFAFVNHWIKAQDLSQASDELNRLKHKAEAAPPSQRADFAQIMARLLLLQGQHAEGLRWAEDALRLAVPAGFSGANLSRFEVELVYALAANDRLEEALALIEQRGAAPVKAGVAIAQCLKFLIGGGGDLQLLRTGLVNAQQIDFLNLFDRARRCLTQICETALANDIETEFVQRLIAVKRLRPSRFTGPTWPWPVRIRTLGDFKLEINGRAYVPSHKAQDKPLDLLKLLVTCQTLGRDSVDKYWLTERLWPDADAGNARKSLEMATSRLRKLLECDDAVTVNEGRVQLSPTRVWTDINSLRSALEDVRSVRDDSLSGRRKNSDHAASSIKAVLALYTGDYFAGEEGPPWLLAGRQAISSMVRHALITADAVLAGAADSDLIPALQRALLHDPASEDLARSLMCAHLRGGQYSEALAVYRRLRDILSVLMGVAPSTQTEQIRRQALNEAEVRTPE